MRSLPAWLWRAPRILYALAVLFFAWSFLLTLMETDATGYAEPENPVARLMLLRGLYQASLEALYIAANGILVQILLGIWENCRTAAQGGGGE